MQEGSSRQLVLRRLQWLYGLIAGLIVGWKAFFAHLSLALADLGGICEGIFHTVPDMARNFDTISARPGHERNLMRPYFAAHGRDGVAKGQDCFWIPGGGSRLEFS